MNRCVSAPEFFIHIFYSGIPSFCPHATHSAGAQFDFTFWYFRKARSLPEAVRQIINIPCTYHPDMEQWIRTVARLWSRKKYARWNKLLRKKALRIKITKNEHRPKDKIDASCVCLPNNINEKQKYDCTFNDAKRKRDFARKTYSCIEFLTLFFALPPRIMKWKIFHLHNPITHIMRCSQAEIKTLIWK